MALGLRECYQAMPLEAISEEGWLILMLTVITVKILKFGTTQTIAIIVLKIEKFDVTLH